MKRVLVGVVVLGLAAGGGYAYLKYRNRPLPPTISWATVTRGDIVDRVGATGTLQAVTTVQVGTQVSGTIQDLSADFNSLVKKGQVLARLDPSLFQTQIEQARANLLRAQADVERLRVGLDDAQTKLTRARELSGRQLLPRSELDAAEVATRAAVAQLRSAEAQVTQAQASLNQNQVNLDHTIITSPIDGLVISRNVDIGQTVAASMQAPTLFVLAADLTKMQVVANLDESDVGRIRPRQHATFRVDAYPTDEFSGTVVQVRLQPLVQQNVVTYATVIDVPNLDLRLKPGMTANVNVEIARRSNVLKIPNTALRFQPTNEMFAALGQTPPAGSGLGGRGRAGAVPTDEAAAKPSTGPPTSSTGASPTGASATPVPGQAQVQPAKPSAAPSTPQSSRQRGAGATAPAGATASQRPTAPKQEAAAAGRGGRQDAAAAAGAEADQSDGGLRGGRGRLSERLQSLPPEERERMLERMRARGFDPGALGGAGEGSGRGGGAGREAEPSAAAGAPSTSTGRGTRGAAPPSVDRTAAAPGAGRGAGATGAKASQPATIDALFGPLPTVESAGRVWIRVDNELRSVRVRLGISDGQSTELIAEDGRERRGEAGAGAADDHGGRIEEGTELVTNVATSTTSARPATSALPPFLGPQPGGRGGGFGGGGGGFGGNRGGGPGR
jgi:HlyD family secretion protein